jgi:hypothetical protein
MKHYSAIPPVDSFSVPGLGPLQAAMAHDYCTVREFARSS